MTRANAGLAVQDGQTVVFIGDSITDCGRRGDFAPLGSGYVRDAVALMAARYPQRRLTTVNRGISGDVSTGLQARWDADVIAQEPDWVSVMIGINDLHNTLRPERRSVPPETFRQACTDCLARTAEKTPARLILMDPFYMCRQAAPGSFEAKVLELLREYLDIVTDLAGRFGAIHVRTHEMFQDALSHRPADFICPEPVHPNPVGHLMIAHAWLDAVGW